MWSSHERNLKFEDKYFSGDNPLPHWYVLSGCLCHAQFVFLNNTWKITQSRRAVIDLTAFLICCVNVHKPKVKSKICTQELTSQVASRRHFIPWEVFQENNLRPDLKLACRTGSTLLRNIFKTNTGESKESAKSQFIDSENRAKTDISPGILTLDSTRGYKLGECWKVQGDIV